MAIIVKHNRGRRLTDSSQPSTTERRLLGPGRKVTPPLMGTPFPLSNEK
jgi:hypothetical protein